MPAIGKNYERDTRKFSNSLLHKAKKFKVAEGYHSLEAINLPSMGDLFGATMGELLANCSCRYPSDRSQWTRTLGPGVLWWADHSAIM